MTIRPTGYRFATEAQWNACLFALADRDSGGARSGLRAFAPYARPALAHASAGAFAPAASRAVVVFWHDASGRLLRLSPGDEAPESFAAPHAIAQSRRMIVNAGGLWVAGEGEGTLHAYDEETFTRRLVVPIAGARVIDLAGDGQGGLLALVERAGAFEVVHLDCGGQVAGTARLDGIEDATAFAYLKRFDRIVVLAGRGPQLYWFASSGGAVLANLATAALHPCFEVTALAGDEKGRLFVAGIDGADFGGAAFVVILDGNGDTVGEVPLEDSAKGVAVARRDLLVATARGLFVFSPAQAVPEGAAEARCMMLTPVLLSPDREDARRWLRIEVSGDVGEGATLEIAHASTDDPVVRDKVAAIAADTKLSQSRRVAKIRALAGLWREPVVLHGSAEGAGAVHAAPLYDVHDRYAWVCISLAAAPRATLPSVAKVAILYPGRTLMEYLPAIYQRAESQPGDFLRALVGVLESTTQDLDARIAAMGRHIDPASAPEKWLDFLARWLGLPWDDALDAAQKRCIATHAAQIGRGRGTRAGLEALLECLVPGTPRRFLVTDATADLGFARAGGDACPGSVLPAVLGGLPITATAINVKAIVGRMRLPCEGQVEDGAWQLAGRVRVEIVASGAERGRWQPWMRVLLARMVPLTTRLELRWVGAQALRGDLLDSTLVLEPDPIAQLGGDAVLGMARLPERGASLSALGPDSGTRLH